MNKEDRQFVEAYKRVVHKNGSVLVSFSDMHDTLGGTVFHFKTVFQDFYFRNRPITQLFSGPRPNEMEVMGYYRFLIRYTNRKLRSDEEKDENGNIIRPYAEINRKMKEIM